MMSETKGAGGLRMSDASLVVTFLLGQTLGTASQVAPDAALPIEAIVEGQRVTVELRSWGEREDGSPGTWMTSMVVTVDLTDTSSDAQTDAADLAQRVARRLTDLLRITQPTTGLAGIDPPLGATWLYVDGDRQNASVRREEEYRPRATILYGEQMLPGKADLKRAINNEISVDHDLEILLSQARHFAMYNPDSNHSLAIYLAALACEVKMKRVLHRDTPAELQSALVEEVPVQRQYRGPIQSLYSSVARRYLGRSLKKEMPITFRGLTELFDLRNRFTHQAIPVANEKARELAGIAHRAVTWAEGSYAFLNE